MADFYIDPVNGDNTNDGSLATPWRNISGATAAKGVLAGHTIGIAKTPDPVSAGINASWTNLDAAVNLASALTATVTDCETIWTANANVTPSTSTIMKEGTAACQLAITSGFATGKVAYFAISDADYSDYTKLSFWFRNNAALLAGRLKVCLCSDTTGDTIVDTFNIPAIPSTNSYVPLVITKDGGGALGASIQSVAVYADIDPGTITILLDNLEATDDFGVDCMIGKENDILAEWWCVQSIKGTTILIDSCEGTNYNPTQAIEYYGDSETVALYYLRPTPEDMVTSATGSNNTPQVNGSSGSLVTYEGGYNMVTGLKDGHTFMSGQNGLGAYIGTLRNYTAYRNISGVRFSNMNNSQSTVRTGVMMDFNQVCGMDWYGANLAVIKIAFYNGGRVTFLRIGGVRCMIDIGIIKSQKGLRGVVFLNCYRSTCTVGGCYNSGSFSAIAIHGVAYGSKFYLGESFNGVYGLAFDQSNVADAEIYNLKTQDNSSGSVSLSQYLGTLYMYNTKLDDAVQFVGLTDNYDQRVHIQDYDQVVNNCRTYTDGGLVQNTDTVRYVASGTSVQLSPTSTNRDATYPLQLEDEQIVFAVEADVTYRLSVWARKDNLGLTAGLKIAGGQIAGIPTDLTSEISAADTWEQLTIDFTPTEDGTFEATFYAYGGTAYNAYFQIMDLQVI